MSREQYAFCAMLVVESQRRCLTMTLNSLIMHEIKVVYESDMHLVEKRSSDIEGLAWYSFWKHYSPKSRYVFANSSSCQYDAVEVSFQEKLDGLFWSAVVSRTSRFRLFTRWSHHWWFDAFNFQPVYRSTALLKTFAQYIDNNKMN